MSNSNDLKKKPEGRKTTPGYATPDAPVSADPLSGKTAVDGTVSPVLPASDFAEAGRPLTSEFPAGSPAVQEKQPGSGVEVSVVHARGPAPSTAPLKRTIEVWTLNHIYVTDASMTCIEVRDAKTGAVKTDHSFLGTRLVGGQLHGEKSFELSCPFPRAGSLAVFESRKGKQRQFSCTSMVERVVIRLHVVTVPVERVVPTWSEITAAVDDQS